MKTAVDWGLLALGALLVATGLYWMTTGWDSVQISGAVLLAGGLVTIAIAWAIIRFAATPRLAPAAVAPSPDDFEAEPELIVEPAPARSWGGPAIAAATAAGATTAVAAAAALAHGADDPEAHHEGVAPHAAAPDLIAPMTPEPAASEPQASAFQPPEPEPPEPALPEPELAPEPIKPRRFAFSEFRRAREARSEKPLPPPPEPETARAEVDALDDATVLAVQQAVLREFAPASHEPAPHAPAAFETWPAPPPAAHVDHERAGKDHAEHDHDERNHEPQLDFAPSRSHVTEDEWLEPPAPAIPPAVEPEPVEEPETLAETARSLGRASIATAPEPEPPPVVVPLPAPEPAVIGRYASGDTNYTMYADGSIEAQTPDGVMRFASLVELRRYVEQRD